MGTEITVISFLTTPLIFFLCVILVFKTKFPNSKAIIILSLNLIFLGYFLISGYVSGYLIQSFLVGGFLLIPFQIISIAAAYIFGNKLAKYIGSYGNVT